MNNITEKDFYDIYYDKIKHNEQRLLNQINSKLKQINEQSESKMVEHVRSRIKSAESASRKLNLAGYDPTGENAVKVLSDVIGVRLVTHFIGDIYMIRNILVNCGEFDVIKEKDYVRCAKPSGYRGYHIIIGTNVDGFKF